MIVCLHDHSHLVGLKWNFTVVSMYTYCCNYFMVSESQVIMLYTLNLYSAVHQLYCNKTKKKNHPLEK